MVVAFLSERGISLRTLPEPLPREWFVPIQVATSSSALRAEPEWTLSQYLRADERSYVEVVECRR